MNNSDLYFIWLSKIFSAGSGVPQRLLSEITSDEGISKTNQFEYAIKKLYECDEGYFSTHTDIKDEQKNALLNKDLSEAEKIYSWCEKNGVGILTPANENYPEKLKLITNMPLVLYYKGALPDFNTKLCIGVVGTRHPTEYGRKNGYTITYDLSRKGAVIVSGMALGCDGVAHRATLDSGGITVAVLGCGIDVVYPPAHKELMEEIIAHGCVMTEYSPGTTPDRFNFPLRNRIISGLSSGIFVIEAPFMSGALITAETAIKQGRDVFALPGKVGEGNSVGTNDLIMNGAYPAHNANHIIMHYYKLYKNVLNQDISFSRFRKKITENKENKESNIEATENKSRIPAPFEKKEKTFEKKAKKEAKAELAQGNTEEKEQTKPDISGLNDIQLKIYEQISDNSPLTIDEVSRLTAIPVSKVSVAFTVLEIKKLIKVLPGGAAVPIK